MLVSVKNTFLIQFISSLDIRPIYILHYIHAVLYQIYILYGKKIENKMIQFTGFRLISR